VSRRFQFIDVFSEHSFSGNPLPVFLDAAGLSGEQMQKITQWMNLSETAFLLPPTDAKADYRVRIFTLDREMPFAGHPTLGSCHAWLAAGGQPQSESKIIQECGIGLVTIRQTNANLAFAAPELIRSGPVDETKIGEIANALQIERNSIVDAQWADNGPGWVVVLLESAQAVLDIEPLGDFPTRLDIGVVGPCEASNEAAFEIRALCTDHQGAIREDPVTGSLNASIAQWLLASDRASAPYIASQGARMGRSGRIDISQDSDGTVWVGGCTRTLIEGEIVV
jgi:PhzF family phenazine biosynthesis protein